MNKDVIYIEPEDDITDIVTKIENSKEQIVAIVPPKKADILHSSINIKLMDKAGKNADKKLVLVTEDAVIIKHAASVKMPITKDLQSAPAIPTLEEADEEAAFDELNNKKSTAKTSSDAEKGNNDIDSLAQDLVGEAAFSAVPPLSKPAQGSVVEHLNDRGLQVVQEGHNLEFHCCSCRNAFAACQRDPLALWRLGPKRPLAGPDLAFKNDRDLAGRHKDQAVDLFLVALDLAAGVPGYFPQRLAGVLEESLPLVIPGDRLPVDFREDRLSLLEDLRGSQGGDLLLAAWRVRRLARDEFLVNLRVRARGSEHFIRCRDPYFQLFHFVCPLSFLPIFRAFFLLPLV